MAFITAEGVGISMPWIREAALDRPFAWMMRFRKISRIFRRVGSVFSTPNLGMTFSQMCTSCPARIRAHSRAAERLPASTTGKSNCAEASIFALCRMHSLLPPSVPPTSRKMSGLMDRISSMSSSVSWKEYTFNTFAPAPRLAWRAASAVSSGTRPLVIMRRPPAAEEQA